MPRRGRPATSARRALPHAVVLAAVAAVAVAVGGCGEADDESALGAPTTTAPAPSSGAIELTVVFDDGGGGKPTTGTLTCRGAEQRAAGSLAAGSATAATLCATARGLTELLTTQPEGQRACTQIYGGDETAHVTGTIGATKVDRRFSRENGCAIADFTRAAGLLQP